MHWKIKIKLRDWLIMSFLTRIRWDFVWIPHLQTLIHKRVRACLRSVLHREWLMLFYSKSGVILCVCVCVCVRADIHTLSHSLTPKEWWLWMISEWVPFSNTPSLHHWLLLFLLLAFQERYYTSVSIIFPRFFLYTCTTQFIEFSPLVAGESYWSDKYNLTF